MCEGGTPLCLLGSLYGKSLHNKHMGDRHTGCRQNVQTVQHLVMGGDGADSEARTVVTVGSHHMIWVTCDREMLNVRPRANISCSSTTVSITWAPLKCWLTIRYLGCFWLLQCQEGIYRLEPGTTIVQKRLRQFCLLNRSISSMILRQSCSIFIQVKLFITDNYLNLILFD